MGRYEIEYSWVTEEYRQKILNRLQLVDNKITIIPNPTRKVVEEIDLGINFNGYPLGESHADIIDAIADHVYEAVPLSKRETKNLNYVVVLYALEDDV